MFIQLVVAEHCWVYIQRGARKQNIGHCSRNGVTCFTR